MGFGSLYSSSLRANCVDCANSPVLLRSLSWPAYFNASQSNIQSAALACDCIIVIEALSVICHRLPSPFVVQFVASLWVCFCPWHLYRIAHSCLLHFQYLVFCTTVRRSIQYLGRHGASWPIYCIPCST